MMSSTFSKPFYLLCAVLALTAVCGASDGDWEIVKSLPEGTPISVKAKLRHLCTFQLATDTTLTCRPKISGTTSWTLSFERKEIRQVRLEHSDDTNELIGFATGGAIGFVMGASGHRPDTSSRLFDGVVAGALFGFAGRFMNRALPITHKSVIYKRSKD